MVVHGLAGVLDHCGVDVCVPFVYEARHHDDHHRLTYANYSFPVPWLDVLHGTFSGTFAGKRFSAADHRRMHISGKAPALLSPTVGLWVACAISVVAVYAHLCGELA